MSTGIPVSARVPVTRTPIGWTSSGATSATTNATASRANHVTQDRSLTLRCSDLDFGASELYDVSGFVRQGFIEKDRLQHLLAGNELGSSPQFFARAVPRIARAPDNQEESDNIWQEWTEWQNVNKLHVEAGGASWVHPRSALHDSCSFDPISTRRLTVRRTWRTGCDVAEHNSATVDGVELQKTLVPPAAT